MRILLPVLVSIAAAAPARAGRWSFERCRAYVGRITVSDKGAAVDDEPKLEARPASFAEIEREVTAGGAGRRVAISIEGDTFVLDRNTPTSAGVWEQFDPKAQAWVIYGEDGARTTVTVQRFAAKSSRIGGVATDTAFVRRLSSDGQYLEQVYARDPGGRLVYQNGTACGQAFGEEPSITLQEAGAQAPELKFPIKSY